MFWADTLGGNREVDLRVVVKQYLTGYNARGQAVMDNNMVYRIDRINIFPDYDPTVARTDTTLVSRLDTLYYRGLNIIYEKRPNLRPSVLRQAVPLYPNYVYNSAQVNRAYSDLMALGYFKSARIAFEEQARQADDADNYVSFIGATADSTRHSTPARGTSRATSSARRRSNRASRSISREHHVEFLRAESHPRLSEPQHLPRG